VSVRDGPDLPDQVITRRHGTCPWPGRNEIRRHGPSFAIIISRRLIIRQVVSSSPTRLTDRPAMMLRATTFSTRAGPNSPVPSASATSLGADVTVWVRAGPRPFVVSVLNALLVLLGHVLMRPAWRASSCCAHTSARTVITLLSDLSGHGVTNRCH